MDYTTARMRPVQPVGYVLMWPVQICSTKVMRERQGTLTPTLSATIVYDPDIRHDGNATNGDCKTGNNHKVITSQQLAQKLAEAH